MSNNKEINKLIREKLKLEKEMKDYPDWCFCGELLGLEPDIDYLNDIPIEFVEDVSSKLFNSPIYICKRCGKKHCLEIVQ